MKNNFPRILILIFCINVLASCASKQLLTKKKMGEIAKYDIPFSSFYFYLDYSFYLIRMVDPEEIYTNNYRIYDADESTLSYIVGENLTDFVDADGTEYTIQNPNVDAPGVDAPGKDGIYYTVHDTYYERINFNRKYPGVFEKSEGDSIFIRFKEGENRILEFIPKNGWQKWHAKNIFYKTINVWGTYELKVNRDEKRDNEENKIWDIEGITQECYEVFYNGKVYCLYLIESSRRTFPALLYKPITKTPIQDDKWVMEEMQKE